MSFRVAAIVVGLLLVIASAAGAQQTGLVAGRVLDQTGAALPGVTIDLVVNGHERTTTTDKRGDYSFESVPAGRAELTYRLLNFSLHRRSTDIAVDGSVTVDVVLTLSLNADVIVTGAATFRNIADVENPAENLVGIAAAASQGAIIAAQLDARPMMRPGEVLETVPGMVISQHSGEGKANQYYLRGFNLDHGTDFSTTVAGVPVNTPTGAHAHGYSDISFLIPELVSGVQYKKGPYFADDGDFSAAGSANINYVNQLERPLVRVSGGSDSWGRLFGAASPRVGRGFLLGALEVGHDDGPWVRPDNFQKINGVLRYSQGDNRNGFSVTGLGYWADWDSTDQVAGRAIDDGAIERFGFLDPTDGGEASRQSIAAEFQRSNGPASLRGTGFLLHNSLNLFSNFTYFLDNPETGDQFEQAERRTAAGGRLTYRRLGHFFARHIESAVGVQLRRDWLAPVGLYHTAGRRRLGDDARGRSRSDDGGRSCGGGDRMDPYGPHDRRTARGHVRLFGGVRQSAELWRWLGRPRQSEVRGDLRSVARYRDLRKRRHGVPQQRCAGHGHARESGEWRGRRSGDAARSRPRSGSRSPHRARFAGCSRRSRSGTWARFRAAVRRRRRHDGGRTSEPACRRRMDQLRARQALADPRW